MMDRKKNISFNNMAREVSLFIGFVLLCVISFSNPVKADYESSLNAIKKCDTWAASRIQQEVNKINILDKTDFRMKGGVTYADLMDNVYSQLQKIRAQIEENKNENLECSTSDITSIIEHVKSRTEQGTKRWLQYAEEKLAEGEECLSGLDLWLGCTGSNTKDAISNRKKELTAIQQQYNALLSENKEISKEGERAINDLKKCAASEMEEVEEKINELKQYSHKTRDDASSWVGTEGQKIVDLNKEISEVLKELKQSKKCSNYESAIDELSVTAGRLAQDLLKTFQDQAKESGDDASAQELQEQMATVAADAKLRECPLVSDVKAKYKSGCWSCLVLEKLTSAFLHAAKKGLPITQKVGVILLLLGALIWMAMWGLRNVSSFTEVQIGNILNELLKFLFKFGLAYWLIFHAQTFIKDYLITPIMSTGAIIGEQFWDSEIEQYTYNWEDEFEPDDPAKEEEMEKIVEENNKKGMGGTTSAAPETIEESSEVEEDLTGGTGVIEPPQPVAYDSVEAIVQDIQKAFIAVLQKQLSEIRNSCGGPCGSCRYMSCSNAGHKDYIRSIFKRATGTSTVDHYCQASITAAMDKLHDLIGSEATTVLKRAGAGCYGGIGLGAVGDVKLCENGQQVYNQINVGDTIYYHEVIKKGGNGQKVGGGSGHHAVTYIGNSRIISFNGDSENGSGSMCNSYYYTVTGKVLCVSCLIRKKLKENPQIAKQINTGQLSALAKGVGDMSLINYEGGSFSPVSASDAFGSGDYSSLIVEIPEVKYTGPTDIMPKSIMNSILGATRAITNKTADVMVLGDVIMCYASMKNGGGITVVGYTFPNVFLYIGGIIVWCLGFLLTAAIAYYLIDMSFKIGFAVLALPMVIGLWPFELTQKKFGETVSIIAKASATFAFFAITTNIGMAMMENSFANGLNNVYDAIDQLASLDDGDTKRADSLKSFVSSEFSLFSTTFLMCGFCFIYFLKLVQATLSDVVNKFFPDKILGDTSPMHSGATMVTNFAKNIAMKPVALARDIATHQTGKILKAGMKGGIGALLHPKRTAKSVGNFFKNAGGKK